MGRRRGRVLLLGPRPTRYNDNGGMAQSLRGAPGNAGRTGTCNLPMVDSINNPSPDPGSGSGGAAVVYEGLRGAGSVRWASPRLNSLALPKRYKGFASRLSCSNLAISGVGVGAHEETRENVAGEGNM
jgi:hypothetical protein